MDEKRLYSSENFTLYHWFNVDGLSCMQKNTSVCKSSQFFIIFIMVDYLGCTSFIWVMENACGVLHEIAVARLFRYIDYMCIAGFSNGWTPAPGIVGEHPPTKRTVNKFDYSLVCWCVVRENLLHLYLITMWRAPCRERYPGYKNPRFRAEILDLCFTF